MKEPRWLTESEICTIHDRQLAEHGGIAGLRDSVLLNSGLDKPRNLFLYEKPTIHDLAAAYAYGITRNHPFNDGNKRTGFLAAYTFLGLNGWRLNASQEEVVLVVIDLAAGKITQQMFSKWLKSKTIKI